MNKLAHYFSHDTNASQDPKILQMCSVYKAEGYGWFWMLVEKMSEQENYKLPIKGKYAIDAYALRLYCDGNALHKFIDDCIKEFFLFKTDGDFLWSESLIKRMGIFEAKSELGKKAADARWLKHKSSASITDAMPKESIGNANKGNEIKGNEINNNGNRNVFQIFEDNYQKLTTETSQRLNDLITEYSEDKVKWALQIGIDRNKRFLAYIEKTLENDHLSPQNPNNKIQPSKIGKDGFEKSL